MLRLTSSTLCLVIVANLSFPVFADAADLQQHALLTMDPAAKGKLAALADRLEARIQSMTEEKRAHFYGKLLLLVEGAERRIEKMSNAGVLKKLEKLERRLEQKLKHAESLEEPSDALTAAPTADEHLAAFEVNEVVQSAMTDHLLPSDSGNAEEENWVHEIAVDRVNRVLLSFQGGTSKERILNAAHLLKQELSTKTAQKKTGDGSSIDRKIADSSETVLMILIISPIIVGIAVGILIGSVLIPVLAGVVLTALIIKLIIEAIRSGLAH